MSTPIYYKMYHQLHISSGGHESLEPWGCKVMLSTGKEEDRAAQIQYIFKFTRGFIEEIEESGLPLTLIERGWVHIANEKDLNALVNTVDDFYWIRVALSWDLENLRKIPTERIDPTVDGIQNSIFGNNSLHHMLNWTRWIHLNEYATNVTALELNGLELTGLPKVLGRLSSLQVLNLKNNQLRRKYCEKTIVRFHNLSVIDLSENPLEELPNLSTLKKLVSIKANYLPSSKYPRWIQTLPMLGQFESIRERRWFTQPPQWLKDWISRKSDLNYIFKDPKDPDVFHPV